MVLIPLIFASTTGQAYVDQANIISVVVTEVILVFCYILNRSGRFAVSRWALLIFMLILMVLNASASSPPHLEIVYLLTLPAIGLFALSRREMLWLSALVLVVMFVFVGAHSDSLQNSVTDLISVVAINAFLLLLISIYRDWLEASRSRVLVEKETQLQLMLDNLPAIVWRLDTDLQPLSSAGGPHDAEMREQIIASLTGEDAYRAALKVVLAGVSVNFEHVSNGIACRSYAEAMVDANGAIIGCSGITVDISSQKQEEERLRTAAIERERMRVLENFLESASHDLRTPLTEMNMSIELLNRAQDPERRAYHGQRLTQGIQRLDHILDMMFTMVRLDLARPEQNLPLDLNHLVELVVKEEGPSASKQKVRLSSDLATDLENIASYDELALQ
ncbi:MAG: hypothetical protein KC519_16405, partial [Anaerolineae bacterium]|nr:hypothetical protein [Anaerolineae bacterium]